VKLHERGPPNLFIDRVPFQFDKDGQVPPPDYEILPTIVRVGRALDRVPHSREQLRHGIFKLLRGQQVERRGILGHGSPDSIDLITRKAA